MKRKLKWSLLTEAIACVVFCILGLTFADAFTSIMAFPFEQIGLGLRALSSAGLAGNIIAIVFYCALCLAPVAYFVLRALKKHIRAEDWLLILLSIVLFAVIYMMVNPADIGQHLGFPELINAGKAFFGATVYSIVAGYLILRTLRFLAGNEAGSVYKHLKILLAVVCVALVFGIFYSGLTDLITASEKLAAGNNNSLQDVIVESDTIMGNMIGDMLTGNMNLDQGLGISYVFLVLQYLVNILPLFLGIFIVFSGLDLITALQTDPYSESVVASARKTGRVCRYSIIAIMLSQIGVNILQLALGSLVRSSYYTLNIPLLSIVLVLTVMLLAGYFEKARQLKADNDRFI